MKSLHFSRPFRDTIIQTFSDEGRVGEEGCGVMEEEAKRNVGRMWGEIGSRKERREEEEGEERGGGMRGEERGGGMNTYP